MLKFSIIIPCYNHGQYLDRAVRSIQESTYKSTEIIVVNDGSTDSTSSVMQNLNNAIFPVTQSNAGLSAARNAGLLVATGDLLLFLDADDWVEPWTLEVFANTAAEFHSSHLFTGGWKEVDEVGNVTRIMPAVVVPEDSFHYLLRRNLSPCHTIAVRRSFLSRDDLFDTTLRSHEDWDFWLRLASRNAKFQTAFNACSLYRRSVGSMSGNRVVMKETALTVISRWATKHRDCRKCRITSVHAIREIHYNSIFIRLPSELYRYARRWRCRAIAQVMWSEILNISEFFHSLVSGIVYLCARFLQAACQFARWLKPK